MPFIVGNHSISFCFAITFSSKDLFCLGFFFYIRKIDCPVGRLGVSDTDTHRLTKAEYSSVLLSDQTIIFFIEIVIIVFECHNVNESSTVFGSST